MTMYWLMFIVPWLAAINKRNLTLGRFKESKSLGFQLYFVLLLLLVGWRHQVGGDWGNYLPTIDASLQQSFADSIM